MKNKDIYLLLGTNLGDRESNLSKALKLIELHIGNILALSSVLETKPWGFDSDSLFLNQAIEIESDFSVEELLVQIKKIEKKMGRTEKTKAGYESRLIDIDILFFGNFIVNKPELTVPHSQLHQRYFALKPLCEIAPGLVHPVLCESMETLLSKNVSG